MPKYNITVTMNVAFELDTTELEDDFAANKAELVDKLDPNDEDAILEYIQNIDAQDLFTQFTTDEDICNIKVEKNK